MVGQERSLQGVEEEEVGECLDRDLEGLSRPLKVGFLSPPLKPCPVELYSCSRISLLCYSFLVQ